MKSASLGEPFSFKASFAFQEQPLVLITHKIPKIRLFSCTKAHPPLNHASPIEKHKNKLNRIFRHFSRSAESIPDFTGRYPQFWTRTEVKGTFTSPVKQYPEKN